MEPIGRKRWVIAEGYIPASSMVGADRALISHETGCILNTSSDPARIRLTLFFTDRDPVGPYEIEVGARRTAHVRFNDLTQPEPVPRDTSYSSLIESDVPVVVQHTRLDSRTAEIALVSTMAFPVD